MYIVDNVPVRLQQAIVATQMKNYDFAVKIFEEELDLLMDPKADFESIPVRSFYGLCIAMTWGETEQALTFCRAAVRWCPTDPDLLFNLGMVQLRRRRRDLAVTAFREGLKADPHHPALCHTRERLRRRRRPLIPYLNRAHPVNKFFGLFVTRVLDRPVDEPI